jgi:hypothetical protein
MVDHYTRAVLTVIALSLSGLFIQNINQDAIAQSQTCGSSLNPCYIKTDSLHGLPVQIIGSEANPVYIKNTSSTAVYITNHPRDAIFVLPK